MAQTTNYLQQYVLWEGLKSLLKAPAGSGEKGERGVSPEEPLMSLGTIWYISDGSNLQLRGTFLAEDIETQSRAPQPCP